jgi:hypothetical protein
MDSLYTSSKKEGKRAARSRGRNEKGKQNKWRKWGVGVGFGGNRKAIIA